MPAACIDRAADPRDEAALALAADPHAGAYVIGGEMDRDAQARRRSTNRCSRLPRRERWRRRARASFSGSVDGAPQFGLGIGKAAGEALKARDDLLVTDLRSIAVQGLVDAEHLPPIAEAKALLALARAPPLLPELRRADRLPSGRLERATARSARPSIFPRTDPVVIMLRGRRRPLPARPLAALRADDVVVPRRLRRAGRKHRGRGAARGARGGRHRVRPRRLFRVAALAVSRPR